jgi:hypothetical protein
MALHQQTTLTSYVRESTSVHFMLPGISPLGQLRIAITKNSLVIDVVVDARTRAFGRTEDISCLSLAGVNIRVWSNNEFLNDILQCGVTIRRQRQLHLQGGYCYPPLHAR